METTTKQITIKLHEQFRDRFLPIGEQLRTDGHQGPGGTTSLSLYPIAPEFNGTAPTVGGIGHEDKMIERTLPLRLEGYLKP